MLHHVLYAGRPMLLVLLGAQLTLPSTLHLPVSLHIYPLRHLTKHTLCLLLRTIEGVTDSVHVLPPELLAV